MKYSTLMKILTKELFISRAYLTGDPTPEDIREVKAALERIATAIGMTNGKD